MVKTDVMRRQDTMEWVMAGPPDRTARCDQRAQSDHMPTATDQTTQHGRGSQTVIQPSSGWANLRLDELWAYRELLYFMVWRDLKVRYKQTAIGAMWAVLQPVALTIVFTLFLGSLSGIAPSGVPYALFALTGLVPWNLFSQSLTRASDSLVNSANLIQKVYFPRLLLPIASVGSTLADFAIGLLVLLVAMLAMAYPPGPSIVWLIPLAALAVSTALAVGIWLSAINVRYRDVRHAVPFIVQLWFFCTPVIYSVQLVPEPLRVVYYLNPMAGVIDGFRWALLGQTAPPVGPVLLSALVTGAALAGGIAYFRRVERAFADII
jgi:lipopolysaccharide transport system permease protein